MAFIADELLPRLCHLAMRNRRLLPYRKRTIALADGRVLEIGAGSGLNLPFYGASVREVIALEPSPRLIAMAQQAAGAIPVQFVSASAEAIPIDDRSVDTVVTTWTLCSIPDPHRALAEMRRVLRRGGRLVFVEHGLAPDARVRGWQEWLTPLWVRVSGGCHLNRPVRQLLEAAGFRIDRLQTGYMPGLRPMAFTYEGTAIPA
jgi:ubiquinone/menaquinone biosynthesis C-methylase UbiE